MNSSEVPNSAPPRTRTLWFQPSGRLRSGWRLALFFLLVGGASACFLVFLRLAHLLPPRSGAGAPGPLRQLPQVAGVLAIVLVASSTLLRATDRRGLATLGLSLRVGALPGALLGVLTGALPIALTVAIFRALGVASIRPFEPAAALPASVGIAAVAVTCLASALEELLWRGYPLQLLIEGVGRWVAVLLTAVLWAAGHSDNPGANVTGFLELVLSGALLAWIVIRTGSLWFAIGYHVAWNVVAAHFFGLVTSGMNLGASVFATTLAGPGWLTGGTYGFEASPIAGVLDILCLSAALSLSGRVRRVPEAIPYFERRRASAVSSGETLQPAGT